MVVLITPTIRIGRRARMRQMQDICTSSQIRIGKYMQQIGDVSDAQLVTSIARYSEVALAEVYRRHGGAVYGLARRVLNNTTEAEDVTQEVFLRLWNEPDRFDADRGTLRSYLLAKAHARAVDAVRSLNSRRLREAKDAQRTANAGYDM